MPDSVFIKELENGVATETHSIPDSQAEKWILDKFKNEKTSKFIVNPDAPTEKEFEKEVESVSKEEISEYAEKVTNEPVLPTETPVTLTEKDLESVEYVSKKEINNFIEENISEKSKKCDDFLTAVNKPSHYQGITITGKNGSMEFEAIEIIDSVLDQLNLPPAVSHAVGDALKYQLRCGKKESDNNTTTDLLNKAAQDLRKGGWYLTRGSDLLLAFAKKRNSL